MTDLTDDQVRALLAHYDLPTDCDCDGDDCVKCSHHPTFQERASKQLKDAAPDLARALLDARAELARVRADATVAVADIVRSVWGRCEALEDEAADKLAQPEKLTDHEKGFWRGQKTVAKSIRRSTEMPTAEAIAIRRAAEETGTCRPPPNGALEVE